MTVPTVEPYANSFLIGHEKAEQMFLQAWQQNALHNSFLISGPQGIGKATFAYRVARFLLATDIQKKESRTSLEIPQTNGTFRLVATKTHPDLKVLERDFIETDKKKVLKAIKDGDPMTESQLQDLKKSSVIRVDEVRAVIEFMRKKSFDGNWRIVIIDSIDDLNTASANALLKILEEPPVKSLLFLISHNPMRLLPTIRSRCAKINLQPLSEDHTASLLRRYEPTLSETDIKGLSQICGGSIGRALNYAKNNGLAVYRRLEDLFYAGDRLNVADALKLCDEAAKDEDLWNLTIELSARCVSENIKGGQNITRLGAAWDHCRQCLRSQAALNMDKKTTLFLMINELGKALSCS
jgi:DNA polymerase-3 subunit delta'